VAPRPRYAALDSERGRVMPTLENGLARYLEEAVETGEPAPVALTEPEEVAQ
jgi:dTDP-4-dehydrorhamnose reductase